MPYSKITILFQLAILYFNYFQLNIKYFHTHSQTSQAQKVNKYKHTLPTSIHVHTRHTLTNMNLKNKL